MSKETETAAKPKSNKAEEAEKEKEFLAEREAEILKKYKNVTPGSIQREDSGTHAGKLTVEITCKNKRKKEGSSETYECGNTRRVATSDLFQVKLCEECVADLRLARRRRKAKTKRADARKAKEATGGTAVAAKPAKTAKAAKPKADKKPKGAPKKVKAPKPLTPVTAGEPVALEQPQVEQEATVGVES